MSDKERTSITDVMIDGNKNIPTTETLALRDWVNMGIKYFTVDEFDSPDSVRSGLKMDIMFVKVLDLVRERCGFPLKINSGYRTKEHNDKVGQTPTSAHTKGLAVDVACTDSYKRKKLLEHLMFFKIRRIRIYPTHIHVNGDPEAPEQVSIAFPK